MIEGDQENAEIFEGPVKVSRVEWEPVGLVEAKLCRILLEKAGWRAKTQQTAGQLIRPRTTCDPKPES